MKRLALTAALAAALGSVAAHAGPGGVAGSGSVLYGCSGGQIGIAGQNPSGIEWVFEVGVWCPTSLSEVVVATGNWNPANGGPVQGLGFGSLSIGKLNCGSNSNVLVQAQMPGGAFISEARASINRFCS